MRLVLAVAIVLVASPVLAKPSLQISSTTDAKSDAVMSTRVALFQACFTKERNRDTALRDHVSALALHISVANGKAQVPVFDEAKSVKDDNVKSCVALTIVRLTFPKTASELDYTLTYTP